MQNNESLYIYQKWRENYVYKVEINIKYRLVIIIKYLCQI